jgi:hypothetical protein
VLGAAGERDSEQSEAADRRRDAEALAGIEAVGVDVADEERENADASSGNRLHERERRERERTHVEPETERLPAEPLEPGTTAEQQPQ